MQSLQEGRTAELRLEIHFDIYAREFKPTGLGYNRGVVFYIFYNISLTINGWLSNDPDTGYLCVLMSGREVYMNFSPLKNVRISTHTHKTEKIN